MTIFERSEVGVKRPDLKQMFQTTRLQQKIRALDLEIRSDEAATGDDRRRVALELELLDLEVRSLSEVMNDAT